MVETNACELTLNQGWHFLKSFVLGMADFIPDGPKEAVFQDECGDCKDCANFKVISAKLASRYGLDGIDSVLRKAARFAAHVRRVRSFVLRYGQCDGIHRVHYWTSRPTPLIAKFVSNRRGVRNG